MMRYFAIFDDTGLPTAFYCDEVHGKKMPLDVVEITEAHWREFVDNPGQRRWDSGKVIEYVQPLPPVDLVAYAAEKRWEKEVGGVEINGMTVSTDDRSKMLISGARQGADSDPTFTTRFKFADGQFSEIDAPTIVAISNAVLLHVRQCFSLEEQVLTEIEAGAISSLEQIDRAFA